MQVAELIPGLTSLAERPEKITTEYIRQAIYENKLISLQNFGRKLGESPAEKHNSWYNYPKFCQFSLF